MMNSGLLVKKIETSGLKRSFIAKELGITRGSLYNKLNGISDFNLTEVVTLCRVLSITDSSEKERIFFAE